MTDSSSKYYVVDRGEQTGPFALHELKDLNYVNTLQIWTPGLADWVSVKSKTALNREFDLPSEVIEQSHSKLKNPETLGYKKASVGMRLLGFIINSIPFFLSFQVFESSGYQSATFYFFIPIASVITYKLKAGNFGHIILGLKVINSETGEDCNEAFVGFFRELVKAFLMTFLIPELWLLFDKRNQNVYDKIFGTMVVKKQEESR